MVYKLTMSKLANDFKVFVFVTVMIDLFSQESFIFIFFLLYFVLSSVSITEYMPLTNVYKKFVSLMVLDGKCPR